MSSSEGFIVSREEQARKLGQTQHSSSTSRGSTPLQQEEGAGRETSPQHTELPWPAPAGCLPTK